MALVIVRRPQHAKDCLLRGAYRKLEIEAPVDHQHGLLHARSEVERIHLGESPDQIEATAYEHRRAEPRLRREHDGSELRSPTGSVEPDGMAIEFGARLQVVESPAQVVRPLDDMVAVEAGRLLVRHLQRVPALERALEDRQRHRAAALEDEREQIRRRQLLDGARSEEHTSELQSLAYLVCRLLLEKK